MSKQRHSTTTDRKSQTARYLRGSLLTIAVFSIMFLIGVSFILPRISPPYRRPDPWRRDEHAELLKDIAIALIKYEMQNGKLPPAIIPPQGNRQAYSWRVALLPYLEKENPGRFYGAAALHAKYDFTEPWNGPHNKRLVASAKDYYCLDGAKETFHCLAVVQADGQINRNHFSICPEGTHDIVPIKVMLMQVKDSSHHWMEPTDLTVDKVRLVMKQEWDSGQYPNPYRVLNFCTTDASVRPAEDWCEPEWPE